MTRAWNIWSSSPRRNHVAASSPAHTLDLNDELAFSPLPDSQSTPSVRAYRFGLEWPHYAASRARARKARSEHRRGHYWFRLCARRTNRLRGQSAIQDETVRSGTRRYLDSGRQRQAPANFCWREISAGRCSFHLQREFLSLVAERAFAPCRIVYCYRGRDRQDRGFHDDAGTR